MRRHYYGIYVKENDRTHETLVWFAPEPYINKKAGISRRYFIGGSGIVPCISPTHQYAHALIKKIRTDFAEEAQFYVRRVAIIDL